jgi:hypothetical protein
LALSSTSANLRGEMSEARATESKTAAEPRRRWIAWLVSVLVTIAVAWRFSPLWGLILPAGVLVQSIFAARVALARPGSLLGRVGMTLLLVAAGLGLILIAFVVWMSGALPRYD